MNKPLSILSLAAALLLCAGLAAAEPAEDGVVAVVNGEELLSSAYSPIESAYRANFESAGYDLSDEAAMAYVQDLALTTAIEDMLVRQDMTAQGFYDFDEETERWIVEQGNAAYASALSDVGEALRGPLGLAEGDDVSPYAEGYADTLGVTAEDYIDVFRTQTATLQYYDWLTRDQPVTDEDIRQAYDERVAASRALYENDVAAFESALSAKEETWYKPDGYRSILQILLPAEGETGEEKLAGAKDTLDAIEKRLQAGESFQSLIAEYGTDSAFDDESFYEKGYQVHRDSVLWDEAFVSAAFSMQVPGDHSQPFASDLGVHILYYLGDSAGGPVAMTDDVRDALAASLYTERCQARLSERIDELSASADVQFP